MNVIDKLIDQCSESVCYSKFLNSFYTVSIPGQTLVIAFVIALFLSFWGLKRSLAAALAASFIILTLLGLSKIILALIFFTVSTSRSSFKNLTIITSIIGTLVIGKWMALTNLLWFIRDSVYDPNHKNIQLISSLLSTAIYMLMTILGNSSAIFIISSEATTLRLDPKTILNSFEYSFPRFLFWQEFSITALFGLAGIVLVNFRIMNILFFIPCLLGFFKIINPVYFFPFLFALTPILKMSRQDKLLTVVSLLFLAEISAQAIEGVGHLLPLSGVERLLEGVWDMSVGVLYIWYLISLILRCNLLCLSVVTLLLAIYFDPVLLSKSVERTHLEHQVYPKFDFSNLINSVTEGGVKFSDRLKNQMQTRGITFEYSKNSKSLIKLNTSVNLNRLRFEWPSYNHRAIALRVRAGDCEKIVDLRGLPANVGKNLGGVTFSFECQAVSKLIVEDIYPKLEFPFTIDRIYYE